MINIKRVDHIYVSVPPDKIHEANDFYTQIMGFEPMHRPDCFDTTCYWYKIGDIEFHIGIEKSVAISKKHFALEVTDLKGARAHLETNGVRIEDPEIIPGRQRFMFYDPYGNLMELLEFDH